MIFLSRCLLDVNQSLFFYFYAKQSSVISIVLKFTSFVRVLSVFFEGKITLLGDSFLKEVDTISKFERNTL